jgi:aminopeptidase S
VSQTVTVPADCARASLVFWLQIETSESGSRAYDTFTVRVNGSTLATWSNVHAGGGWIQRSADLSAYAGQTVTVAFTATEDYSLQTGFLLDDVSLQSA